MGGDGDDVVSGVAMDGADGTDYVNGGDGDDQLIGDDGDIMTGGDGADDFYVAGDEDQESPIEIMDFDQDEDSMIVVWDTVSDPDAAIDLVPDDDDPDLTHVMIGDTEVAQLYGAEGLSADDFVIMSQEDFDATGLAA
ncbi:MAG: hypothetical protein CML66_07950 [Rhodobacteraceae bacterium]|nr:hypothetical protein [Paracoccaceae bacterium]MAY45075.1 hypothetical protein [Paracoccaceae bacterium]